VCGIVLMTIIGAVTGALLFHLRGRALGDAEAEVRNLALVLAEHTNRSFQAVELVQKSLVGRIESLGIATSDEFEQRMASRETHMMLKDVISGLPQLAAVTLISADGRLMNFSRYWPVPSVEVTDRDYYHALSGANAPASFISAPLKNKVTGTWTIFVARRVSGPGGEFLGIILGAMELRYFEEFYRRVSLRSDGSISLMRRDGMLLARHPHIEDNIGKSLAHNPQFKLFMSKANFGAVRLTSVVDGQDRLIAAHVLPDYPLAVAVGVTVASALANWQIGAWYTAAIGAIMALVVGCVMFLTGRQIAKTLYAQNLQLDSALNNMSQGLCMFDAQQQLMVSNALYARMYGLTPEDVRPGTQLREIVEKRIARGTFAGSSPADYVRDVVDGRIVQASAHSNHAASEPGLVTPNSRHVRELSDGRIIEVVNHPIEDGGWVATHEDITDRARAEQRVTHMAEHDMLTGLPNRARLCQELDRALARAEDGQQLALLYLDLDHFKRVNDAFGHGVGDELLRVASDRLRGCVRETDMIARLGGDEFAVLQSPIRDPAEAADLAMRIDSALRAPFDLKGYQALVGVSIGISVAPRDAVERDHLLRNADLALYGAKESGRGTYHFYGPELDTRMMARQQLETDLRGALADGQLELHYQPIIDLQTNAVVACEALLRWHHPVRGMVSPAEFIPIAEESGLIRPLGEWVLRRACHQAAAWPQHVHVAVNLSPAQLKAGSLVQLVTNALASSGLSPRRLELEITETVLMQNTAATLSTLHQLRGLGVRIALDDFGTGYSSLSHLRGFPFDKIKIDRSFVESITEKEDCVTIVQAVTAMAHRLGMRTTAEGVETEDQRQKLRELGCTEMQGYLFSRPQPVDQLAPLLLAQPLPMPQQPLPQSGSASRAA
jgi:diguanylate cyclase (GGDEF)-like protein